MDLLNLDLLHTMQIGMLVHLQQWIFHLIKTYEQLDNYDAIWLYMSTYNDLTPKHKSNEEFSQCNRKEIKEMSQYLLEVVTQSLRGGDPTQSPIFNPANECKLVVLEFHLYAQYKFHDNVTLSYMEGTLHRFHTFKDVFLLRRACNQAKVKANALRTELLQKRKVDEETNAETWTL